MVHGCQTCLRVIKDPSEGVYISSVSAGSDAIPLAEKLADCVPELIADSLENAVLCHSCAGTLTLSYQFKQRCLETQQKIYGFLQQIPDSIHTDIGEIAAYYQRLEKIAQGKDPTIEDPSNINVAPAEMPYSCERCPFSCLDRCVMQHHKILHRNQAPPHKCGKCSFIFPTEVLFLEHLATHSDEQPYACTLCDFVTSSLIKLKKHGWVHRKAFQCNICWKRFTHRFELDAHVEIHTCELESKPFQCGLCEFKCDSLVTIGSHSINSHKNTYNCKTCTVKCRTQRGLMQHAARAHRAPQEPAPNVEPSNNELQGSVGSVQPNLEIAPPNLSVIDAFSFTRELCHLRQNLNSARRTSVGGLRGQNSALVVPVAQNTDVGVQESVPKVRQLSNANVNNSECPKNILKCKQCSFECDNGLEKARHWRLHHSKYGQGQLRHLNSSSASDIGQGHQDAQVFDSNPNESDSQTILIQQSNVATMAMNVQGQKSASMDTGHVLNNENPTKLTSVNVVPGPTGKKKYRRNRKRTSRTRVFVGPNCFVRMKKTQLEAMGITPLEAAATVRDWKLPPPSDPAP